MSNANQGKKPKAEMESQLSISLTQLAFVSDSSRPEVMMWHSRESLLLLVLFWSCG
jgi:hypothetical protein